ncbi:MAG TPA: CapA family protein [Bacteroidales bacterium]|nr:CapA family protein [Bacteroidales bacterium]
MIKIAIAGDFCPINRVDKLLNENKYESILGEIRPLLKVADYSIVNLECPVIPERGKPILKRGPILGCSPSAINAIKYAGFKMVALANNHIYDYGDEGVISTITACLATDIDTVGGGRNLSEAKNIKYISIKNRHFAFLNFCENEFSIATSKHGGSNPLDLISNSYQIKDAKQNADYVIVLVHGGHEHYQLPSKRMKDLYRFFIDSGADSVINNHQHCFSGYEVYHQKPIFYGLGNFCFDWPGRRNSKWNEGYMIVLTFDDGRIEFQLNPYIQGDHNPGIVQIKDISEFNIKINELNEIIADDEKLEIAFYEFVNSIRDEMLLAFEPYSNKYLKALRRRKLIPSFISPKRLLILKNIVECESHKDVLLHAVNKLLFR